MRKTAKHAHSSSNESQSLVNLHIAEIWIRRFRKPSGSGIQEEP